jgi:hypothetical protein
MDINSQFAGRTAVKNKKKKKNKPSSFLACDSIFMAQIYDTHACKAGNQNV